MTKAPLTIGRLACSAGVNVETVRYYQRRGLIIEPEKPAYGFRYYPAETVARVQFIKRAQRLGFSLRQIGELLALGDGHCEDVRALATRKCADIEAQMDDLAAMKSALEQLLVPCRSHRTKATCPMVEALADPRAPVRLQQRNK
ncbi:MAG: Hg(II)-responsive transcriptional regulator [Gammaproteobacteria bacterium]|nr:MAG: Hg(II)-responsive transcriptional regulator [Gammaproteobacteria bacterium]